MSARRADLLELAIGDAHAGPGVDQHQLPLQRGQPRRMLRQHGVEQRADAELLGALALERDLGNGALDDLDANRAAGDVLRRHDGAAQMKAGGAIDIADRSGDRSEVGLRHLLADERPPDAGELVRRDHVRTG
jgi:hypothetical protein